MIPVNVVVDDEHAADIGAVAVRLRAAGMTVDTVLDSVGVITGAVPDEDLDALHDVAGVASVSRDGRVSLAPPEADVQ